MKNFVILAAVFCLGACGMEDGDHHQDSNDSTDGGNDTPVASMPDPVVFPSAGTVCVALEYVQGCSKVQMRGFPGVTDLLDRRNIGNWPYACGTFSGINAGTYLYSYVGDQCATAGLKWADYGQVDSDTGKTETLFDISSAGRAHVWADWYDGSAHCLKSGSQTGLKSVINGALEVSGVGNLQGLSTSDPVCQ